MSFFSKTNKLNINNNVPYITFNTLSEIPFISHAYTTKDGGVSKGYFSTMNMSFEHDNFNDVTENYKIFCNATGFNFNDLVASSQDHHTFVRVCTEKEKGIGIYKAKDIMSVDGLITNVPGVTLVIYFADCIPVSFVDIKNKAIGLAHAGWRGTVAKICKEVIDKMNINYGTNPEDLVCTLGPGISRCCYEVDLSCANEFYNLHLDDSKFVFPKNDKKFMVDLLETNRQVLVSCGVLEDNIVVSDLCTKCNSDILWSHRATNGKRGTMCAMMKINS